MYDIYVKIQVPPRTKNPCSKWLLCFCTKWSPLYELVFVRNGLCTKWLSILHCIQIFTNTCVVTMQVKRAIERVILHKLTIYNEYICLCWVSILFGMICCFFSNCGKSSTSRFRSLYITFYLCCKCATFLFARTPRNAMKRSIEICLIGAEKTFIIVFSFNVINGLLCFTKPYKKRSMAWWAAMI